MRELYIFIFCLKDEVYLGIEVLNGYVETLKYFKSKFKI